MKLIILQNVIKKGLSLVERAATKTSSFPVLGNILLKGEGNFLSLAATNLEIAVIWWALAKVEKEGSIVVPSIIFSGFVSSLPDKPIELAVEENQISIKSGNYKTLVKGQSLEDFPIIPKINEGEFLTVEAGPFCQSLSQVVSFAVPSTTKPEISGVYLSFQKKLIKMVATDSFRLGEKRHFVDLSHLSKEYSLILPQKTAREIINIFSEEEGELKIYLSPNQIVFEKLMEETQHPKVQLISRLIEGEYPDYEAIIPKKYETQAVLGKAELLNQIKTASLFSGKTNTVRLKISPDKNQVEVFSQAQDLGSYYSFLPGKIKGKEVEISFNHRFLTDGLSNIKNAEVIFELNKENGPGVLKPAGQEDYLYIAMPMKTD